MSCLLLPCTLLALATLSGPDDRADAPQQAESKLSRSRVDTYRRLVLACVQDEVDGGKLGRAHFAPLLKDLADKQPDDFIGYDCLCYLASGDSPDDPDFARSLDLLTQYHAQGSQVGQLCRSFGSPRYFGPEYTKVEGFFKKVASKNPDPDIRAEATFALALFLKNRAALGRQVSQGSGSRLASKLEAIWGPNYLEALRANDPESSLREAETILERAKGEFPEYLRSHPVAGSSAPAIVGDDISGAPMKLEQFRGKVVALSFWGFGCLPCRAMFAHDKALVVRLVDRPFVLLGVNNDARRDEALRLATEQGITWRSWWDGGETGNSIAQAWVVRRWPSVFIIDPEGLIRYVDPRGKALDVVIDSLLLEYEGGTHVDLGRKGGP